MAIQVSSTIHSNRERGYSLAEMMIAVGIASIVLLGVGELISSFMQQSSAINSTVDADEEALRLQYFFSLPLKTAVNLKSQSSSANGWVIPPAGAPNEYEGKLFGTFDSDNFGISNGTTTALAVFERDVSALTNGVGGASQYQPVGIYYQQSSSTTYGMLYVAYGDAAGNIVPSQSGYTVGNITRLSISNVQNDANGYVMSFTINVTMRYPTAGSTQPINWCDLPGCLTNGGPHKDTVKSFQINLPNNHTPAGSIAGRVYFLGRGVLP